MAVRTVVDTRFRMILTVVASATLFLSACSGGKPDAQPGADAAKQVAAANTNSWDPCALLSADEVQAAVGWKPSTVKPYTRGDLGSCTYTGPRGNEFTAAGAPQKVEAGIGICPTNMPCQELPEFASSEDMVKYRRDLYKDTNLGGVNPSIVAIQGLGVPAIEHEMAGLRAFEMAIGGKKLAYVTSWESSEATRSLAEKMLPRARQR
jgi:hypothetical protein